MFIDSKQEPDQKLTDIAHTLGSHLRYSPRWKPLMVRKLQIIFSTVIGQRWLLTRERKDSMRHLLQGCAFAVGDAKQWDRQLDVSLKSVGNDRFTNKNPSYQIALYMQHSSLDGVFSPMGGSTTKILLTSYTVSTRLICRKYSKWVISTTSCTSPRARTEPTRTCFFGYVPRSYCVKPPHLCVGSRHIDGLRLQSANQILWDRTCR